MTCIKWKMAKTHYFRLENEGILYTHSSINRLSVNLLKLIYLFKLCVFLPINFDYLISDGENDFKTSSIVNFVNSNLWQ